MHLFFRCKQQFISLKALIDWPLKWRYSFLRKVENDFYNKIFISFSLKRVNKKL
jgi:hypothetical protein